MPRSAGGRDICAAAEQCQRVIQHSPSARRGPACKGPDLIPESALQVALRLGRPITATATTAVRAAIRAMWSALTLLAD